MKKLIFERFLPFEFNWEYSGNYESLKNRVKPHPVHSEKSLLDLPESQSRLFSIALNLYLLHDRVHTWL